MVSHGFVSPTCGVVLSADDSLEQTARVQSEVIGLARRAESIGFDGVWAGDSVLAKPRRGAFGPPSVVAAHLERYADAGVERFATRFTAADQREQLQRYADIVG